MFADIPRFRLRRVRGDVHHFFVRIDPDKMLLLADFASVGSARLFDKAGAIEHCKYFRAKNLFDCRVVTLTGEEIFEEETRPPAVEAPDTRNKVFVCLDDNSKLGYIAVPAVGTGGRNWACRACDVPSLGGREVETTYAVTPLEAVQKFVDICKSAGVPALPSRHPDQDRLDEEELALTIKEIKRSHRVGNLRVGDR